MFIIAKPRESGKTHELLTVANENNAQILTTNKRALQAKASAYQMPCLNIIDLEDLINGNYDINIPVYIHKAEKVLQQLFTLEYNVDLEGMSITYGDGT